MVITGCRHLRAVLRKAPDMRLAEAPHWAARRPTWQPFNSVFMILRLNTTLADLLTPRLVANPFWQCGHRSTNCDGSCSGRPMV
jgi:hypothetical protein